MHVSYARSAGGLSRNTIISISTRSSVSLEQSDGCISAFLSTHLVSPAVVGSSGISGASGISGSTGISGASGGGGEGGGGMQLRCLGS